MLASVHLTTLYELGGVTILIGAIVAAIRALYKMVRHMGLVHEAIVGRTAEPGVDAIPSMIDRFHTVDAHLTTQDDHLITQDDRLATIEKEYRPNGGTSLRDSINRNEKMTSDIAITVEQHMVADEAIWHELTDKLLVISGGQELAAHTALDVAVVVKKAAEAAAVAVKEAAEAQAAIVKADAATDAISVREKLVDQAAVVRTQLQGAAADVRGALDAESTAAHVEAQAQADERDRVRDESSLIKQRMVDDPATTEV